MPATQRKCIYEGLTLDVDRHYIGSVTATTHQEKRIITLESNPSRGTVLPAQHGKGKKCDINVKYKRTDAPSLLHQQKSTKLDIHGPLQTRGETKCPGAVSVSCLASRTRHECPRHNESVYTVDPEIFARLYFRETRVSDLFASWNFRECTMRPLLFF